MEDQIRELQKQADEKGMVLVDSSNTDALFEEYRQAMQSADELCEIVDPENKPFESKYKARDLLDGVSRKLEATKAIATLDKNASLMAELSLMIAALQVKTGLICWDCEEPHNAQVELDQACEFYFPGLIEKIESLAGEGVDLSQSTDPITHCVDFEALLAKLPPDVDSFNTKYLVDGMKCLNILGILWSGRGQPGKAVCYLLTAKKFYDLRSSASASASASASDSTSTTATTESEAAENAYTHNLFYLAQAYGHLQDSNRSSMYCRLTLQRQLLAGLTDIKSMLEWVKNCAGIADYFLAFGHYASCYCALASAERILKEHVIKSLYDKFDEELAAPGAASADKAKIKPNFVLGNLNAAEIEADIHRRWAILDVRALKRAVDYRKASLALQDAGVEASALDLEKEEAADRERLAQMRETYLLDGDEKDKVAMFRKHPIPQPENLFVADLATFEQTRLLFLRAATRIESAKKYYVLDGYVTDHCILAQEYSKLYHYLAEFEVDIKRRIAMETRRLDMLTPLIKSLSKVSYEVLHKQISYELGETALLLMDLKLDKVRGKTNRQDLSDTSLKKSDLAKYNEYCKLGLAMFAHFIHMYAHNKDRSSQNCYAVFETWPLHRLASDFLSDADESQITEEEVRPFLNAHFLSCRIMSKIVANETTLPPGNHPSSRGFYLIQCLKRYDYIAKLARRLCERRGVDLTEVFGNEFKICEEMIALLPSKIDRMCYLGESGLSL